MRRRRAAVTLATVAVFVLAAIVQAWADPAQGIPVVVLDQPRAPVRLTQIQPEVTLMPSGTTLSTVWFVRGVMTNMTSKRITAIETIWVLVGTQNEHIGAVTNRYERPLGPAERRQTIVGVLTELLYKRGVRVVGVVRRVQFEDGSFWTPPPPEIAKVRS